jgi:hypothetical protein
LRTADQDFTVVRDADLDFVVRTPRAGQDGGLTVRAGAMVGRAENVTLPPVSVMP